ncbi:SPOR domain-containing protein, partial [Caulobacter sp. S45]|uniref:SPOR domain-containing protein n=1 Tax=Caulobacter sp. S45 TaxID=1641861 RepID=UPI001C2D72C7
EPVMAVKTAPPPASQTAANAPAPSSGLDVYNAGESPAPSLAANTIAASPAPTFAPSAEQPAPRPAPSAATVAMLAKPSAPTHIERRPTPTEQAVEPSPAKLAAAPAKKTVVAETKSTTTQSAASKTSSDKMTVTKTATSADTSTAETKTAALTPLHHPALRGKLDESELAAAGATRTEAADADNDASAAAARAVAHKAKASKLAATDPVGALVTSSVAAASAPSGRSVVQIGAFSSSALADKGYADVSSALPGKMSGKAKHVLPLDKDGTTLYRTWLSGFATRADAQAFCEALRAKGKTCLVKG